MGSLFSYIEAQAMRSLMADPRGGLCADECVVDLFCGAGGWGEGAKRVGLEVDYAINHDDVAIGTHADNNPECVHHRGDAWRVKPVDVVGDRPVGLLLASAACTTHSRARGSAPVSKRVHMLGWCIARWMEQVAPRVVLIENVPEWLDWGPLVDKRDHRGELVLDQAGRPVRVHDPKRKGMHFRRWWNYCKRLGYQMEQRVLDAADFGSASRRKRLFIIARNDGMAITWPAPTHGGPSRPHRRAADVIDWSDLGTSIFDRPRPLRPKTLKRIVEGIRRYVLNDPSPFVLRVTQSDGPGRGWHVRSVDAPMATQTTRQDLAVCTPVVQQIRGDVMGRSPTDVLPTITAGNGPGRGAGAAHAMGIATPIIAPQNTGVYGQRPDRAGPTITTKGHQSIIAPILATTGYGEREGQAARVHRVAELLGTCVNGSKQAVVTPLLMNNTTNHTGGRADGSVPTVTTGGQCGVVAPIMVGAGGSGYAGKPRGIDSPMNTVKCDSRAALVAPVMAYMNQGGKQSGGCDEPARTVVAGGNHAALVSALMMEYYGNNQTLRRGDAPLGCCTTVDRHGLVSVVIDGVEMVIVDILFRMLRPHELAAAMGFPASFRWPKTQRETVRLIGNAVQVDQSEALVRAVLPRGRSMNQERATA